jgi:hypothetical protein
VPSPVGPNASSSAGGTEQSGDCCRRGPGGCSLERSSWSGRDALVTVDLVVKRASRPPRRVVSAANDPFLIALGVAVAHGSRAVSASRA